MAKKIRIQLKDIENLEFTILENAVAGDFFNLNEVNNIDFSILKKKIENKESEIYNQKLNEAKINWKNEFKLSQEFKALENEKNNYEKEIESLKAKFESEKKLAISEFEKEIQQKISNLENQIKNNEVTNKIKILEALRTKEDEITNLKIQQNNQINELQNEHKKKIEEMERKKSQNIKLLGEELENWLLDQYDTTFGLIEGCKLEKANKIIGGYKPDFIFSVFDASKQILGKITIEAKSQSSSTETNKKNKDFYEKLDIDRKNNDSEFALLVSELEPEKIFVIKKVQDERYENMFVIRPAYFITFLSIVRYILIKKSDIVRAELNFEEKQKILEEFDDLKNEILSNSLKHIETNIEEILKLADSIEDKSKKIKESADKILSRHIKTIENKIENFKIKKIIQDIEKIEN